MFCFVAAVHLHGNGDRNGAGTGQAALERERGHTALILQGQPLRVRFMLDKPARRIASQRSQHQSFGWLSSCTPGALHGTDGTQRRACRAGVAYCHSSFTFPATPRRSRAELPGDAG
jgi:hypothetical protein